LYSAANRYGYFTVSGRERKTDGDYREKRGARMMEEQSGENLKKPRVIGILVFCGMVMIIAFAVYIGREIIRQVTWNETEGCVLDVRTWLITSAISEYMEKYRV
jgi:hypothetical protein